MGNGRIFLKNKLIVIGIRIVYKSSQVGLL